MIKKTYDQNFEINIDQNYQENNYENYEEAG